MASVSKPKRRWSDCMPEMLAPATVIGVPACLFCAMVSGATPSCQVAPDDTTVAFLDPRPVFKGHVLVVPRQHADTLEDLPADQLAPLFGQVQRLAVAVREGLGAGGTFVAVNNR